MQADPARRFGLREGFVASCESGARPLDRAAYVATRRAIGVDAYELLAEAEKANQRQ